MQVFSWTEPQGTLGAITRAAYGRAKNLEFRRAELEDLAANRPAAASLRTALLAQQTTTLLAEVKRRSPSKGAIATHLSAAEQAAAYFLGGAAGASILTEPDRFGGSIDDITNVISCVAIPILKKDFHVEPVQLYEARALGASAALLIARALSPGRLMLMMAVAAELGLEILLEVRDEAELDRALQLKANMIGVNNRNLETLEIDESTAERIIPLIPQNILAIAESGVKTRADVERYAAAGADAVLVGSSLSAAEDPVGATRALTGVHKALRRG